MKVRLAVASLLLLLAATFMVQNAETTTMRFLAWRFDASRAVLILLVFAAGFLAGSLVTLVLRRGRGRAGD